MLVDDPTPKPAWPSWMDKYNGATISRTMMTPVQGRLSCTGSQNRKSNVKPPSCPVITRKDAYGGSDTQNLSQSGLAVARKRRVHAQVIYYYLQEH